MRRKPGLSRVEEERAMEWPKGRWETKTEKRPESERERLGVRSMEDSSSDAAPWKFLDSGTGAVSVLGFHSCCTPNIGGRVTLCPTHAPGQLPPGLCLLCSAAPLPWGVTTTHAPRPRQKSPGGQERSGLRTTALQSGGGEWRRSQVGVSRGENGR